MVKLKWDERGEVNKKDGFGQCLVFTFYRFQWEWKKGRPPAIMRRKKATESKVK